MRSASWPVSMPISVSSPALDETSRRRPLPVSGECAPVTLRSLAQASALFTFANIVPKVGALLLVPVYVRLLSTAEYGTLALAMTFVGLFTTVSRLGMDGSLMRLHFDAEGPSRGRLYSTLMFATLGVAGMLTIAGVLFGWAFVRGPVLGIDFGSIGLVALLLAFATSVAFVPSVFYRATRAAGKYVVLNVGGFLLTSALVVVFVVFLRLGVVGALVGQLLGGIVLLAFAVYIAIRAGGISFDREQLRASLSFGLPLLPHQLSGLALRLVDRWLIGLLIALPAAQALGAVGVYSFGYQIGSVVTIVLTSVNQAWSPYFFAVGNDESGPEIHREMTTVIVSGLLALGVGVAALAPELVEVIARPGYEAAADVIPVVVLGAVLQGLYTMFVTVVFLSKRTRPLALLTVFSALTNVGLNVVLIPQYGILGAAWATVGAYAFLAVLTYLYAVRLYPMRVDLLPLAVAALLAVGAILVARTVQPANLLPAVAVHAAIALAYAGIIGIFLVRPIGRLRRRGRLAH